MTCPKHMIYGPCGGRDRQGGCEVDDELPCPFVDAPTVRWAGPARAASGPPHGRCCGAWAVTRPFVLADLPTAPLDRDRAPAQRRSARGRRRRRPHRRPPRRPRAVPAVVPGVVAPRPRGGRVGRAELPRPQPGRAGRRARGARRCGRGRGALRHGRPHRDRPPPRRRARCSTSTPPAWPRRRGRRGCWCRWPSRRAPRPPLSAPPAGREGPGGCPGVHREPRGRAGAGGRVRRRRAGRSRTSRACPWCWGPRQARLLAAFPGLVLPPGFLAGILDAPDPAVAGIDAAVRLAEELLDVPGVRGVDLGAVPVKGEEDATCRALATVGRALRG